MINKMVPVDPIVPEVKETDACMQYCHNEMLTVMLNSLRSSKRCFSLLSINN